MPRNNGFIPVKECAHLIQTQPDSILRQINLQRRLPVFRLIYDYLACIDLFIHMSVFPRLQATGVVHKHASYIKNPANPANRLNPLALYVKEYCRKSKRLFKLQELTGS